MLNRVTIAKYAEKQSPFILFGLKFKPKDDNLNSYEITLTLEDGSAIIPQSLLMITSHRQTIIYVK